MHSACRVCVLGSSAAWSPFGSCRSCCSACQSGAARRTAPGTRPEAAGPHVVDHDDVAVDPEGERGAGLDVLERLDLRGALAQPHPERGSSTTTPRRRSRPPAPARPRRPSRSRGAPRAWRRTTAPRSAPRASRRARSPRPARAAGAPAPRPRWTGRPRRPGCAPPCRRGPPARRRRRSPARCPTQSRPGDRPPSRRPCRRGAPRGAARRTTSPRARRPRSATPPPTRRSPSWRSPAGSPATAPSESMGRTQTAPSGPVTADHAAGHGHPSRAGSTAVCTRRHLGRVDGQDARTVLDQHRLGVLEHVEVGRLGADPAVELADQRVQPADLQVGRAGEPHPAVVQVHLGDPRARVDQGQRDQHGGHHHRADRGRPTAAPEPVQARAHRSTHPTLVSVIRRSSRSDRDPDAHPAGGVRGEGHPRQSDRHERARVGRRPRRPTRTGRRPPARGWSR